MFTGIFKVCTAPSLSSGYEDEVTLGVPGLGEINSEVNPYQGQAEIRIYGDGTVPSRKGQVWVNNASGSLVQFEAASNWIIPNSLAEQEDWHCRFTNLVGDTAQLGGNGAAGTWIQLSAVSSCTLILNDPTGPSIQYTVTGDVELRTGASGPAEYTGTILMTAETDEKKAIGK